MNPKFAFLSIFFVIFSTISVYGDQDWTYSEDNPNEWRDKFSACAGWYQSPIDIQPKMAIYSPNLNRIQFNNYDQTFTYNMTNNGHTIVGYPINTSSNLSSNPYISGSNFGTEVFRLLQFHFHWGKNFSTGSEHTIDGKFYPAELHLVHQAASGRLAVVGFFFDVCGPNNTNLDGLINAIQASANEDSSIIQNIKLTDMMPDLPMAHLNGYFRYLGSLTTPPCSEGIVWNVFRLPTKISSDQMQAFYKNNVKFNFRPVQPLNYREVLSSVNYN